jgi:hypothetical protein
MDSLFKTANIQKQLIYDRAIEAVIWVMPAVNFELMHESLVNAKGDFNQVVYWPVFMVLKNNSSIKYGRWRMLKR